MASNNGVTPEPTHEKVEIPPSFTQKAYLRPDFLPHHLNKISQEAIILGGGAVAILLQVANPAVGAGVNEHSNFAHRVQDRLRSTMTYIYCMSFGTPQEKQQLADMITRVHADVRGTLTEGPDRGQPYSALDPHLQLWVAATLYATAIDVYQRVFPQGPHAIADDAEHERIYAEYAVLACALQVPPDLWPRTRADFWAYWDREVADRLVVTSHARAVARDLLSLERAPWYLRLFLPAVRVVTAEWLPPRIREEYGCRRHRRTYALMEKTVRAVYPALPTRFRTWPVRFYLGGYAEADGQEPRSGGQRGVARGVLEPGFQHSV
ncbi:hypothetical protein PG993_006224 [Apiospora rasikravindrae]|uniref:ER-bound oxygenase mpaB/mpaB'/Rubber oxygenase catalytic domain-containing protein n=1 Tax=Apiospora rasikravindrae TaxID=990691 RepID=A0ABR1T543_9PEZI